MVGRTPSSVPSGQPCLCGTPQRNILRRGLLWQQESQKYLVRFLGQCILLLKQHYVFFHLFIHLFSSVVLRSKPYVTKKIDR